MSEIALAVIIGAFIISISIGWNTYNYHSDLREIEKTISNLSSKVGGKND